MQKTIYHLIVDRSGSMEDCYQETIQGFNDQLDRIRGIQTKFPEQQITVGLTLFNDKVQTIFKQVDPREAPLMSSRNYVLGGSTALLDAIGSTTAHLENEWRKSKVDTPTTVILVILTDGHENSSRNFTLEQIRQTVTRLQGTEQWTFSFIGATLDAVNVAEAMAISRENSYRFSKGNMKSEVWESLSENMNHYLESKREGKSLRNLFGRKKEN